MAMVNCPSCKKIVNNASQKCPNCGASLKTGLSGKGSPAYQKMHMISAVFTYIGGLLLFLDLLGIVKTYVGSMLIGVGIALQGYAQTKREKEEGYKEKSRAKAVIVMGVFIFIVGIVYLYFDLK